MKEKLLIIGGTGFLGFHFAQEAVKRKFDVYSLSTKPPLKERFVEDVKYIYINLFNKKELFDFLGNIKINYVVNFIGYVDHRSFFDGGEDVFENHFITTKNLVSFLGKEEIKTFVQIGSSDEYGSNKSPQSENYREDPFTSYSFAKVAICHLLQMLYKTEKFPAVIIRLFLVYGPNQNKERFLPNIIKKIINNEKLSISPGEQLRDYCYITDVVDAIFLTFNNEQTYGEVINIASGNAIKIKKVVETVINFLKKGNVEYGAISYRENESMELVADIKKANQILNWKPKISFKEGLKKTILWYQNNK